MTPDQITAAVVGIVLILIVRYAWCVYAAMKQDIMLHKTRKK